MINEQQKPQMAEELIDLRAIWNTLNSYKWRILALAVLVSFITGLVVLQMTPGYRATATLQIETGRNNLLAIEEVYGLDTSRQEYLLTQFEVLKSASLAERVVRHLDLHNNLDFLPESESRREQLARLIPFLPLQLPDVDESELGEQARFDAAVRKLRAHLSINPVRRTQLVNISFESEHPALAQRIANEVGVQYVAADRELRQSGNLEANAWLGERLSELSIQLNSAEETLTRFRIDNDIVDVSGIRGLVDQRLIELTQRIARADDRANQAEGVFQVIQANRNQPIDVLKNISVIANADSVRQTNASLTNARARQQELQKVYGPKHPNMLRQQAEIASFEADLTTAVRELANNAERDLQATREELRRLNIELQATRAEFQTLSGQESEFRRLERNVDTSRRLYDTFVARIQETELTGDFGNPIARFTDQAALPQHPFKPNKKLIVALAFVGTMGLGIVVVFLLDALNDTIRSPEDVEQKLKQRIISALPTLKLKRNQDLPAYQFFDNKSPGFAESIRTMRTALTLSKRDKNSKVLAITSTLPAEGKSTTALNLAFALGQVQKTLLIDADLRKPSIGRRLGHAPFTPGLTDVLNNDISFAEAIHRDEQDCIDVLVAGQYSPSPLELLSSPEFAALLDQLRGQYERIIIDTPPAMAVSDSQVIAERCDAVIYVIKEDSTRIRPAMEGISRILESHGRISGVVLNKVAQKRAKHYSYGYQDGYGHNYQQ